ncbi:MAG: zinc-ribbon domain-containing protein [Deltaproteobacteria bacterium]|nr:zinc-ribbon domain-containing protein [Deltaproteobacteria bacterium]
MIIQCDKCSTKFRIDDSKVTGAGVKVRCTKCQNVFIAAPPAPLQDATPENTETAQPPVKDMPPPEEKPEEKKDAGFGFDQQAADSSGGFGADMGGAGFLSDSSDEGADAQASAFTAADSGRFQVDTSRNFDLSGGTDMGGEKRGEEDSTAGSQQLGVGGEFNFDNMASGSPAADQKNMPEENLEENKNAGGWKMPSREKIEGWKLPSDKPAEEEPPAPSAPKRESVVSYSAPAPAEEEKNAAAKQAGGFDESAFDKTADELEALAGSLPGEENALGEGTEEGEGARTGVETGGHEGGGKGLVIGIIIIVALAVIGGAAYFSGVLSPAQTQVAQKTMDIAKMTGSFVDNKNAGRLLVIQAQIINVTASPQTVRGVRGIVYGSKNEQLSTIVVSAGRTLTAEDLKNMSREDILKAFKDLSSSVIPPRGSAPVMIVFTTVPQGMAEFGIDIIR